MDTIIRNSAFISVGSNMGEKLSNCQNGIAALTSSVNNRLIKKSPFYQTEPVDYKDQDWFINAVIQIQTGLSPLELLKVMKAVETALGRTNKTIRFGPRMLDLDILLYDDQIIESEELVIPHPRMHKRRFVLQPMCDINPDINHPVLHNTMKQLLDNLDNRSQEVVVLH